MRACGRGQEAGVTLVELLVAMTVLAIVFAGTTAGMITSLDVNTEGRAASVATGLATASIEDALASDFADLEDEVSTPVPDDVQTVDGLRYTVTRDVSWVPSSGVTGPCIGTSPSDQDVLLVDVQVDWIGRNAPAPISQQTTVSPPAGLYDPNASTIAVFVSDAETPPTPSPGVRVTITGPIGAGMTTTLTETTDADGCAVFEGVDAGDYDVSVAAPDHVDIFQRTAPDVVERLGVGRGSRVSYEFRYAPEGHLRIAVRGREGGQVPPAGLPGFVSRGDGPHPVGTVAAGGGATDVTLWPDLYEAWVGACTPADPEGRDDDDVAVWPAGDRGAPTATGQAPGTATATVTAGTMQVTWGVGWVPGTPYDLVAVSTDDCPDGDELQVPLGRVAAGEPARFVLPWGTWDVVARTVDGAEAGSAATVGTLDPTGSGPTTVLLERDLIACAATPTLRGTGDSIAADRDRDGWVVVDAAPGTRPGDTVVLVLVGVDAADWPWLGGWDRLPTDTVNGATDVELAVMTREAPLGRFGNRVLLRLSPAERNQPFLVHTFTLADVGSLRGANGQVASGEGREVSVGPTTIARPNSLALLVAAAYDGRNGLRRIRSLSPSVPEVLETGLSNRHLVTSHAALVGPAQTPSVDVTWNQRSEERFAAMLTFDPACA